MNSYILNWNGCNMQTYIIMIRVVKIFLSTDDALEVSNRIIKDENTLRERYREILLYKLQYCIIYLYKINFYPLVKEARKIAAEKAKRYHGKKINITKDTHLRKSNMKPRDLVIHQEHY